MKSECHNVQGPIGHPSGTHRVMDASSKGHVVQGAEHRRLFLRGHIGWGRDNIEGKDGGGGGG
jgi:hypothetical protein